MANSAATIIHSGDLDTQAKKFLSEAKENPKWGQDSL